MDARERAELIRKAVRDTVWMATGTAGFLLQIKLNQINILAMIACMIFMGVPITNIGSLLGGESSMPTRQQPSRPDSSSSPSSPSPSTSVPLE